MDKIIRVDKKSGALVTGVILSLCISAVAFGSPRKVVKAKWKEKIAKALAADSDEKGKLGVYVKDLSSGEEFSQGAEETWYLASGVKVPVAIELLRQVENEKLSLEDTIRLKETDLIDGNGETNFQKIGSKLSLAYLLEQMIIHSDNTASDLLIRKVGLRKINATVARLVSNGFREITTLSDVRRHAYSGIHPSAMNLKNEEIRLLKLEADDHSRVRKLASILDLPEARTRGKSLHGAFSAYYARHLNSATLEAYGELLRKLGAGEALEVMGTDLLLKIMQRVETGKNRIRAGFPRGLVWAHKTGTQYARVCDFGLAWRHEKPEKKVVIASCANGYASTAKAEGALRRLGKIVADSGVFDKL